MIDLLKDQLKIIVEQGGVKMNSKTKKRMAIIIIVSVFIIALFFPYLKAAYLTLLHGEEFEGLELQTHMLNEARYFRVLEYSENEATVFYVSDTGDLITFVKNESDQWTIQCWKTIWSTTGSADEFYWPYYR